MAYQPDYRHHFDQYEVVEIKGHEPGFDQTYYPATIISEKVRNTHRVRYHTLYEEDGDERLTEWVRIGLIRPRPRTVMVHQFPVRATVDAYDNGGWWKGTVRTKTENGYVVRFHHFPAPYEYQFQELRVHQNWRRADNSWTYSLGTNIPQMANGEYYQFQINDDVEIEGHEDGFLDTFYSGTIISEEIDNRYQTRYRTLNSDHQDEKLTRWLHLGLLRPRPPPVDFNYFDIGTTVEAYDNGGWWKGSIRASLADEYLVRFDRYPGPLQYNVHDLRIYQDWNRLNNSWTYTTTRV